MSRSDHLVGADWLKQNLSAPDVRVVDATWMPPFLVGRRSGREQYESGHIPGAVFFDIDEIADPDSNQPHMLPDPIRFTSRVRKLGLGDGNHIVVYDSNGFCASARVWWMFRAMGHRDVSVLDGGYQAWLSAGGEIEDLAPVITERHYTARKRADLVRNMADVRRAADAGGPEIILDARSQGRFDGSEPEPREGLRSGHIPGSVNIPASRLVGEDGRMVSDEELQALLGQFRDRSVITTCGSGVSAAILSLGLAVIGNMDAALYDGSWSEWAAHPDNPIATA